MKNPKIKYLHTIRAKLISSFCLLFVIMLSFIIFADIKGIPYTPVVGLEFRVKQEASKSLAYVADIRKERLLTWVKERKGDLAGVAHNVFWISAIERLQQDINILIEGERDIVDVKNILFKDENYHNFVLYFDWLRKPYGDADKIFIADARTGMILVSSNENDFGADVSRKDYFTGALKNEEYIEDVKADPSSGETYIHFSRVVKRKKEPMAVIITRINVRNIFVPLLYTGLALGREGEILLVNKDRFIIVPLKHAVPEGYKPKPLEYQIKALPATRAASGDELVFESTDYRGVQVLAATRYLQISPEIGWGMVIKRDKEEMLLPLYADVRQLLIIGSFCLGGFIFITVIVAGRLSSPILSLSETAGKIARGDYSARAAINVGEPDEVVMLAKTFNDMIARVQNWHEELKEQVYIGTEELRTLNAQLTSEIAGHKKDEEALRRERDRVQRYLDIVGVMVLVLNTDGTVSLINKKGCEIIDYPECDVIGQDWFENWSPQWLRNELREIFDKMIKSEEMEPHIDYENPILTKSGQERIISWHHTVLRDDSGEISHVLSSGEDITEKKLIEQQIKDSEAKWRSLVENAPDIIVAVNKGNLVMFMNRAPEGLTVEEVLGTDICDYISSEYCDMVEERIAEVFEEGISGIIEFPMIQPNTSTPVWYSTHYGPVKYDSDIVAVMLICRDITQRKRDEEKLRARQREVEELNATLEIRVREEVEKSRQKDYVMLHQSRLAATGEMIGLIAHQWRQPLTALNYLLNNIKFAVQLQEEEPEKIIEDMNEGIRLIGIMSATIDDFRNFFKIDKVKEKFSINKKISDALRMLYPTYKDKNISVFINEKEELFATGFPNEYSNVILNILSNARDAIVKKGGEGKIDVDVEKEEGIVLVRITDNGGGVPEAIIDRIFEPYFTTKEGAEGTGIGLYISRIIIEEHMGGKITVSNTEEGAQFSVRVPL